MLQVSPTITSISVSCTPSNIQAGQTSQCLATVSGTGSYSSAVTWSASDGAITPSGVLTLSAAGTVTIKATSTEDITKSGSVTATAPPAIVSVSVGCSPASILTTQTSACTPTVAGTGSYSTSVTWSVSPAGMGVVSSAGIFTPAAAGTATITATSTQDTTKTGSATVNAIVPPTISAFTASQSTIYGGSNATLTVTLSAAVPTGGAAISLTSSNATAFPAPSTFTVPAGQITANLAVPAGAVTVSTPVDVTASYNGSQPLSADLTIIPAIPIEHVVVIMQENRSFDNFFYGFPGADSAQSGMSGSTETPLSPVSLSNSTDLGHSHIDFWLDWDNGKMDGFAHGGTTYAYSYIPSGQIQPYRTLAAAYTLGDRMFQSNSGPSYPAHQYMIAGESGLADNDPTGYVWGCDAPAGTTVGLVGPNGTSLPGIFPCFDYQTMADLLDAQGIYWRYYAPADLPSGSAFSAYEAISHIFYGEDWTKDVISPQTQVLTDIANGELAQVTWIVPDLAHSDHPASGSSEGPEWVASIVNAIGSSPFWNTMAIFISWDDWGGWYDHVVPPIIDNMGPGFRVPVIVVSPYAKHGYVSHTVHETAGFLTFIENNFGLSSLGTRDTNADDFSDCFDFTQTVTPYTQIKTKVSVETLIHEIPSGPPDDD
ncbi:MAG: alkaline phosphatase family protein [Terracidiphilus sp.]